MRTSDFDYNLPDALIARRPAGRRDESRLLVLRRSDEPAIEHRRFHELPDLLNDDDLLVLNRSRVIPARLIARRAGTGAQVEILLLEEQEPLVWKAMVRPGRKARPGDRLILSPREFEAEVVAIDKVEGDRTLRFETSLNWEAALRRFGHPPLPPYILKARKSDGAEGWEEPGDRERYQTVFAADGASVAAPTAGLHFTDDLMRKLRQRGTDFAHIELDVGAGTFLPVKREDPREHPMHYESFRVPEDAARKISKTRQTGRRVVAVGTTVVRALESMAAEPAGIRAGAGRTNLFIMPGWTFHAVDAMITNFHLPRSTLLMLVAAFAGRERILEAYDTAVREQYRFYSYGDAMLIL